MLAVLAVFGLLIGVSAAQAAAAAPAAAKQAQAGKALYALPVVLDHHPGTKCRKHKAHTHRSCSHCARQVFVAPVTRSRDRDLLKSFSDVRTSRLVLYARTVLDDAVRVMLVQSAFNHLRRGAKNVLSHTERLRN